MGNSLINHFYPFYVMLFYLNTFNSTEDDIADYDILFKIKLAVIFNI